MKHLLLTCAAFLLIGSGWRDAKAQLGFGSSTLFNDGWFFSLEGDSLSWQAVSLPHDWSVSAQPRPDYASCMGYLPGGIGHYRKTFTLPAVNPSATYTIYFEGVYNRSEVLLNGRKLGFRPNGYVGFAYDLTPYLRPEGENVLEVNVDHSRQADSRYYTGSGIYRNVWLIEAPRTHLAQWGLTYELESLTGTEAVLKVSASTLPIPSSGYSLQVTLADAAGHVVAQSPETDLLPHADTTHVFRLSVGNPQLWSTENPALYRLWCTLKKDGLTADSTSVRAGIRHLRFDPNEGFFLNGQNLKMKGVCLHHDAGVLGAAVPKEVWRYRLQQLRQIGVNAIRTGHNPQSPDFYDACDELGLLVMDEAFDEWEHPKRKWLEGWNVGKPAYEGSFDFFEEWSEADVTAMVLRDRPHPCVVLWSIGNEVDYPNDPYSHPILDGSTIQQPMYGGYDATRPRAERIGEIGQRLAQAVRSIDRSRPVTGALAGVVMSNETTYPAALDVVGYNYTENRYDEDHTRYPDRVIYGSETGVGFEQWKACRDRPFIFGQFLWTGFDYLGESGRWPSRGLGTGLLDFTGTPKSRGWFRAALWKTEPFTYASIEYGGRRNRQSDRERQDRTMHVVCYTNAPQARLLVNGEPFGDVKPYDDKTGQITWDIPAQRAELRAEGLDPEGKVVSSYTIPAFGPVKAIRFTPGTEVLAHKGDVALVMIEAVDASGNVVPSYREDYTVRVGSGLRLLGVESGSNSDMSHPLSPTRAFHQGRLLAYVQALEDNVRVVLIDN
ncbi:MAG: DUF4982 domain-containing protein [Bacteroidales bacterium]|nr:DUF4982 domain-containing protein [Bacteroidales bacterium]